MTAKDRLSPKGHLTIRVYNLDGELIHFLEGKNLILNAGKNDLAAGLGGTPNCEITQYGAGEDGTAPVVTDVALTNSFIKAVDSVSYPSTGVVVFAFSMDTTEGNGQTFEEWGLFTGAGNLFSRKTTVPIVKNNTIRIEGEWTITIP